MDYSETYREIHSVVDCYGSYHDCHAHLARYRAQLPCHTAVYGQLLDSSIGHLECAPKKTKQFSGCVILKIKTNFKKQQQASM